MLRGYACRKRAIRLTKIVTNAPLALIPSMTMSPTAHELALSIELACFVLH